MRYTCVVTLAISLAACGGSPSTPSSTSQNPPAPTANRPPTITSAQVTPTWGISTLTTHAFTAAANDPDGDAITYSWDYGNGTTSSSSSGSVIYDNANTLTYQAALTVRDSRGLTATSTVPVTSVTIAGNWAGPARCKAPVSRVNTCSSINASERLPRTRARISTRDPPSSNRV